VAHHYPHPHATPSNPFLALLAEKGPEAFLEALRSERVQTPALQAAVLRIQALEAHLRELAR